MKKSEIVEKLCRRSGIHEREVRYVIDNFLDTILESVQNGENVELRGFGVFYRSKRKERKIYSPIAGKKIDIPEKVIIAFRASKSIEMSAGA